MACTGQSASQYVRSARRHLVRGLKNLSIILENLFQQEVLCEEEVSKIQAEKDDFDKRRQIVDKVLKKGEGACYEFLRIIDKTRKRTLERSCPENGGFDLHNWISCYDFKEETKMDKKYQQGPEQCHNFQNRLRSKAQKLYQKFWTSKKNLCRPNLSYFPLVLDTQGIPCPSKIKKLKTKKSKMSRPKKLRTYIPKEEDQISPSDLMKTNKPILLVGKPGIGKTAVVLEMLRLWTERDDAELDYMIYFDMREDSHFKTAMKLQDLLFSEFSQSDEDRDEVLRDIMKNSENVTMIFDGVTDLRSSSVVQKLVEKDLLPDAKIIVTCRAYDEGDIVDDLPEDFFFRVEVKGFSEQTIRTYLSENLGEEHKQVLNNLELFTLCHVPMYALMVAVCFSSETQPCTITELYINIVRFCLQKNSKTTKRLLNSFIKKEGDTVLALAEAAFDATERKSVILTGLGSEDTCVCPFLKKLDVEVAPTDTEITSIFLHYTMQEFFAALWLLKNPGKIKDVLQQCFAEEKKHMKHLIPFMCRLLSEKAPRLMEYLIPADELKKTSKLFFEELNTTLIPHESNQQSETEDSAVDVDMVFLCQCLYESQSPETCLLFLDKLDYCLDLSGHFLDPFSCCAVSYVVTQSKEKKVKLNLEDVTISEEGVRRLHGCLKNVHWCSPLPCQLWKSLLFCVEQTDHNSSRGLNGNQLHLPVNDKNVADCDTLVTVLWRDANDCFYWDKTTPAYQSLYKVLSKVLPNINSLSFVTQTSDASEETKLLGNLFCTAAEGEELTGEKLLQLLSSVCMYHRHPLTEKWVDFQLDLYSYEPEVALKVLPAVQSVLQSVPTVWIINLSERKASILLEVLKLQSEKKQVVLKGWSHEESEVRSFLQCLPYISQLRSYISDDVKFFGNLFCAAAERDQQTGEKNLQILSSVCTYPTFPLNDEDSHPYYQCNFLLDLYCHVKDYDSTTGMSVLPALQSVLQSVPTLWTINLSDGKASILLEVLKLQSEKKQVEVTGWSREESEVRSFLQCLPYISQLSCYPAFFQEVCSSISIRSREETQQLASQLKLQGFSLLLEGELNQKTCCSVGRVLRFCGHKVDLILTPTKISTRGASVLFKHTSQLHSLRLSDSVASLLFRWMKRKRVLAVPELHLVSKTNKRSEPALLKVVSRVSCLLRYWTVRCLDLTEFCVPALPLITLLLHDAPLKIKLNKDNYQQLVTLLYEIQDKDLSCSFVSKCGGDLSTCCLNWELLHYLLQQSRHTFTVNMRKNTFLQENITHLLPFLDSVRFLRPSPSFALAAIREIGKAQARHIIPGFLKSLDHMLTLTCRKLDSADFAALLFTLKHSDKVKVNLLWTSIPTEGTESLLFTLDRVSQLSVDRYLLLRLVHCCAASNVQQRAASGLLQSLQHRLDLSSSSCVALSDRDQSEVLSLTADDCRAISIILRHISEDTQLDLRDCEVEDSGLDLLLPVPDRVHLRASKAVVLRLLSLVPVNSERDTVRRTESLWKALCGELDLSHTMLDQRTCGALALMLDLSEGLTELDLSHCQLTDQLLLMLSAHLHKVQVLDLSHNQITDASTDVFLQLCSINTSTQTVRLFSNNIVDRTPFNEDKRFEMW